MRILITGGTGFIGSALCDQLLQENHDLVILTREPSKVNIACQSITCATELTDDDYFDVVINLAGEAIADKRWSAQQKLRIINSRLKTTDQLIEYFKRCHTKPGVFISGSAVGYYGIAPSESEIGETGATDQSFSSQLCSQWEATALQAQALGIRTCLIRTGIVLGKNGGALSKMLPIFKLGLGGKIGNGKQWMPWIHLDDLVGIIIFCINRPQLAGPVNGTAPNPATNKEFSQTLAEVLHRPSIMPMPAFVVKLLMGQMGQELLLSGKKVVPAALLSHSYVFKYSKLSGALDSIVA